MCFNERLKQARIVKGYTQEELAKIIGVAKSTLTGYEKGNREPDVFKIKKLAEALEVTADYLLGTEIFANKPSLQTEEDNITNDKNLKKLSSQEENLIKKYRFLDESGKEAVNSILEINYKRCCKNTEADAEFSAEIS